MTQLTKVLFNSRSGLLRFSCLQNVSNFIFESVAGKVDVPNSM